MAMSVEVGAAGVIGRNEKAIMVIGRERTVGGGLGGEPSRGDGPG
jgi:hypothetical protein